MKKVVLITGASSGMGRVTSIYLAEKGYIVYAGSRTPELLDIKMKNLYPFYLDLSSSKNIKDSIVKIYKENSHIDILINNAGYGLVSTVEYMLEEEIKEQYDINVFGLLRVTKEVIPKMRIQREGIIINISSFLGKIGLPLFTFYNSTKYAVEGITDSLRYELSSFNIRVHSVMPGFFDTNFARKNLKINRKTFADTSEYKSLVDTLTPQILEQINNGNSPNEVAEAIWRIIIDDNSPARIAVGEKAKKFLPMKRELDDEEFELRVREYYGL